MNMRILMKLFLFCSFFIVSDLRAKDSDLKEHENDKIFEIFNGSDKNYLISSFVHMLHSDCKSKKTFHCSKNLKIRRNSFQVQFIALSHADLDRLRKKSIKYLIDSIAVGFSKRSNIDISAEKRKDFVRFISFDSETSSEAYRIAKLIGIRGDVSGKICFTHNTTTRDIGSVYVFFRSDLHDQALKSCLFSAFFHAMGFVNFADSGIRQTQDWKKLSGKHFEVTSDDFFDNIHLELIFLELLYKLDTEDGQSSNETRERLERFLKSEVKLND